MNRDDAHGGEPSKRAAARHTFNGRRTPAAGFTLIEILVSLAIITVLVSLLMPSIYSAVGIVRSRKCQAGQRAVGFDFTIFADESLHGFRGSDSNRTQFSMASFVDAQYQIRDFWAWGNEDEAVMPDSDGHDPMRCPEVLGPLTLSRGRHAHEGAVGPEERLSFGFNIRLHVAQQGNPPQAVPIRLTGAVLDGHPSSVPLMWDINPLVAGLHGVNPFFSGPAMGNTGIFANDRYWFPSQRHHRRGNYVFMDGHVAESASPLAEEWDWTYTPSR